MKSTVIFDSAIKENAIRLAENTKVKLSKMKSTVLFWTAVEENSIGLEGKGKRQKKNKIFSYTKNW